MEKNSKTVLTEEDIKEAFSGKLSDRVKRLYPDIVLDVLIAIITAGEYNKE